MPSEILPAAEALLASFLKPFTYFCFPETSDYRPVTKHSSKQIQYGYRMVVNAINYISVVIIQ